MIVNFLHTVMIMCFRFLVHTSKKLVFIVMFILTKKIFQTYFSLRKLKEHKISCSFIFLFRLFHTRLWIFACFIVFQWIDFHFKLLLSVGKLIITKRIHFNRVYQITKQLFFNPIRQNYWHQRLNFKCNKKFKSRRVWMLNHRNVSIATSHKNTWAMNGDFWRMVKRTFTKENGLNISGKENRL